MRSHRRSVHALVALGVASTLALPATAAGLLDTLKKMAGPTEYVVRGRLQTQDGQWLTCFNGIKTGYLGAANMARPGDAQLDPATGQMRISTAAIPAIVMTRDGTVTSNDCDGLASQHLLVLALPPDATAPAQAYIALRSVPDPASIPAPPKDRSAPVRLPHHPRPPRRDHRSPALRHGEWPGPSRWEIDRPAQDQDR